MEHDRQFQVGIDVAFAKNAVQSPFLAQNFYKTLIEVQSTIGSTGENRCEQAKQKN